MGGAGRQALQHLRWQAGPECVAGIVFSGYLPVFGRGGRVPGEAAGFFDAALQAAHGDLEAVGGKAGDLQEPDPFKGEVPGRFY